MLTFSISDHLDWASWKWSLLGHWLHHREILLIGNPHYLNGLYDLRIIPFKIGKILVHLISTPAGIVGVDVVIPDIVFFSCATPIFTREQEYSPISDLSARERWILSARNFETLGSVLRGLMCNLKAIYSLNIFKNHTPIFAKMGEKFINPQSPPLRVARFAPGQTKVLISR